MASLNHPVDYQQFFRSLPENFVLMAPDSTILDNTDSHVAASLKPRTEVLGRKMLEAFPSVNANEGDVITQSHEHVRRFREPHVMPLIRYDLEVPAERGGGFEEMYWQATHYPILNEQGELQYILQRTQNVTEQHRAAQQALRTQQDLAESQERTRFILNSLPVLIWTTDPEGRPDYFNPRWLEYTGHTLAEQTGDQWAVNVHPDDRARLLDAWQAAVQSGELFQAEYRLRRHDGQYRWILVRAVPRHDAGGHITMWVGGGTDIHEQRQLVQELSETNEQQAALSDQVYQMYQKAESQREAYESLFMQAPVAIAIVRGPEHRFAFVNPAGQQIFPHRVLLGHTAAETMPELVDQGIIAVLDRVYQTGEPFQGREQKMLLERDASGELRDTYLNFTYQQFRENDEPAGVMVFASEVTDLVQARQALEKLRDGQPKA